MPKLGSDPPGNRSPPRKPGDNPSLASAPNPSSRMVCGGGHLIEFVAQGFSRVWSHARQPVWLRSRVRFRLPADHHLPIKTAVVVRIDQRAEPLQGLIFRASSMSCYPNSGGVKSGLRCPGSRVSSPETFRSAFLLHAASARGVPFALSLLASSAPGPLARDFIDVLMRPLFARGSLSPLQKSCSSHILVPGVEASPEGALVARSTLLKMAITIKSIR